MKIKRIRIEGYRSVNDAIELELGNVNALIGSNNVGKTNILNAIWSVLGKDWVTVNSFAENDLYQNDQEKDIDIEVEFEEPYKYEQYKGVEAIDIPKIAFRYTKYKIGEHAGERRLEKKCLTADDKPVQILAKKPQKGEKRQYQPLTSIPQDVQEAIPVVYIRANRELRYHLPDAKNSLLAALLHDVDRDFQSPENKISVKNAQGQQVDVTRVERFNQCIKAAIESLKTEDFLALEKSIRDNALLQLGIDPANSGVNVFFQPLTSLDFYKSLNIFVEENGFSLNATELGGGFQNALVIAILKAFEERKKSGAVFLIEEPEMFLHPQMQRSLYKTIRKIGATNQVIYTTHSPHFVTIPEYDEIILVSKNESGTKRRKTSLPKTPELEQKLRKELDPERSEFFFAKRVLFVEGDTEKLALPEYAIREVLDFDEAGGTIVEVGGKRNLQMLADVALSFDIPTGIIYDTDSSDFSDKQEEKEFNQLLDGYSKKGAKVWKFEKNYEEELKKAFTETVYQAACQKYPKTSKAIKARLIAQDVAYSVPDFIKPIIKWLANKE